MGNINIMVIVCMQMPAIDVYLECSMDKSGETLVTVVGISFNAMMIDWFKVLQMLSANLLPL